MSTDYWLYIEHTVLCTFSFFPPSFLDLLNVLWCAHYLSAWFVIDVTPRLPTERGKNWLLLLIKFEHPTFVRTFKLQDHAYHWRSISSWLHTSTPALQAWTFVSIESISIWTTSKGLLEQSSITKSSTATFEHLDTTTLTFWEEKERSLLNASDISHICTLLYFQIILERIDLLLFDQIQFARQDKIT